jgi:plasmid stabilization system protein ParE
MVTKIIWNKNAGETFEETTNFLLDTFSLQTAQNFADSAYQKIDWVTKYPSSGRPVKNTKTLRMVNFGKHHQLYYRVKGKTLFICDFFDTRQDPAKRPY